jgi:hypothetical protein
MNTAGRRLVRYVQGRSAEQYDSMLLVRENDMDIHLKRRNDRWIAGNGSSI